MGASAVSAQDTLYMERELPAVSLDMTAVGTVSDTGAGTSAGTGKTGELHPLKEVIIRFLRNRVAFTDRYGYHGLAGGHHPY